MALRRMVPTRFFKDPDIMALSTRDTQLILIGLILSADDEGRELAHADLLGREMNYSSEHVEAALQELVANDLLLLYQVGRHRYYSLTRWQQWQTIHPSKLVPSKYPAPSDNVQQKGSECAAEGQQECSDKAAQVNVSQVNVSQEKERKEELLPSNVVAFPTSHMSDDDNEICMKVTKQVAPILKLPVNDALQRIIVEYSGMPTLSLVGEADAAREWIDDRKRNPTGKHMTLAFFRRWLQREQEAALQREAQRQHQSATGTHGRETMDAPTSKPASPVPRLPQSLMDLETNYHNTRQQGGTS